MTAARSSRSTRRGSTLLAVVCCAPALLAFVACPAPALYPRRELGSVAVEAEASPAPSPAPSSSVALVKVNDENSITTAGVLAGVAGLLVGGIWVGGALFAASSFVARKKDDDLANALKGISASGLEAVNYVDYLNQKYEVTSGVGSALSNAVKSAGSSTGSGEASNSVAGFVDSTAEAISSFDTEVGIKDTLGGLLTAGGELASQAVGKVVELNEQYRVTDQIKEKIDEQLEKAK